MNKMHVYMITETPDLPDDEEDESPSYEEVHDDGDSGYGNMKD